MKSAISHAVFMAAVILTAYPSSTAAHSSHKKAKASPPEGYSLVWSDEFDADGLPDPAKWDYDTYRNKDGWWNEEEQYYSDSRRQNARIKDGHLIIEARKNGDALKDYPDYGGQGYSRRGSSPKARPHGHMAIMKFAPKCLAEKVYGQPFGRFPKSLGNGPIAAKSTLWNM